MVFASLSFLLLFLPIHFLLYYTWKNAEYRNGLLILFSLLFYAWGEPVWVSLLIFSAGLDYLNGLWIERHRGRASAKLGLISSILGNLGLLAAFKYNVFIYDNLNALLGTNWQASKYSLPVGISFYTFQTLSYTIDVYRGEVKAQRSFWRFLMFVSLFHQLVAGPIVRYAHIASEIESRRSKLSDIQAGILRFCIGLFKKLAIADVAGGLAKAYLGGDLVDLSGGEAWFGLIMFSLQIYFDFSGYSDMAIGLGLMFGFHYLENFNYPYIARSATDFWRRWHISLGSFFRDYVYIPLGGKHRRPYLNLFIVWFLTGLWHGASWNYVFWGLYFGLLIALERLFLRRVLEALPRLFGHAYLLLIAVFGWALFYFEDSARLWTFVKILWTGGTQAWLPEPLLWRIREHLFWLITTLLLCTPIYPWLWGKLDQGLRPRLPWLYSLLVLALQTVLLVISMALLAGDSFHPFIYYRF